MKSNIIPDNYLEVRQSKKDKKIKEKKKKSIAFYMKLFFVIAIIQLIIIGVGIIGLKPNVPISVKDTYTKCFVPDRVESTKSVGIGRFSQNNSNTYIYYGTKAYLFQDLLLFQYNGTSLENDLRTEKLTLTIEKDTERVVAIKGEKIIFYSLDDYNRSAIIRFSLGCVVMLGIEGVFALIVYFFILRYVVNPIKKHRVKQSKKLRKQIQREKFANNTNI